MLHYCDGEVQNQGKSFQRSSATSSDLRYVTIGTSQNASRDIALAFCDRPRRRGSPVYCVRGSVMRRVSRGAQARSLSGLLGLAVLITAPAVAAAQEAAASQTAEVQAAADEVPAYELPSVVVETPAAAEKKIVSKPKSKPAPEAADEPAPKTVKKVNSKPAKSEEPAEAPVSSGGEAESAAAGGGTGSATGALATGGAAAAGPAVSNAGFNSTRVVEQVGTVEEVSAEQIQRSGARTLDQALRLMPGVYVRNGGDGVPRIDIRGLRTRNVTLLLDGVPLNATFDGQFDPRSIPVENIARIKVSRGGSSVLYGPGGNAAVIDIITKGAAPGVHATADAGVGFGKEKDARATLSYGSDTVKAFFSASIYKQDAYHLSDDFNFTTIQDSARRVNSDREDRSFYGNTEIKLSEQVSWGVSVNYREGAYGKPPSTVNSFNNQGVCRNPGTNPALPFNWGPCSPFAAGLRFERVDDYDSLSLQTSGRINLGGGLTFRPVAYYNGLDELTNRFDDKDYATQALNGAFREDASTKIYGGGGQIIYQHDENNLTSVALDAHREAWNSDGFNATSKTAQTNIGLVQVCNANCQTALQTSCGLTNKLIGPITYQPRFNNSNVLIGYQARQNCATGQTAFQADKDLDVLSVAGEHEIKLTDQLSAVMGVGWAEQRRETKSDTDYTYLAGLRFALTEDTILRGNVARKIRFPTLRNLYGLGEGNADLQTEVTQNYEVGFDQRLPAINGLLSVSAFRIDAENFIKKGPCKDAASTFFCNFDSLRFQGIETNLAFSPVDHLNMQVGYTFLDAKNLAPGPVVGATDKLDNEPRHKLMLAASYAFDTGTTVMADYQFVAASYAVSRDLVATQRLRDYHLLNLGFTQDIAGGAFEFYGRVENVLDENYESSFGFPEAGRTFFAGVRTKL